MNNNSDYTLFHKFIETYLPTGFKGINPDDSLMTELEKMMENNNQFFIVGDMIQMKILFTSKRSTEMIGVNPEDVTPSHITESIHPDEIQRHSLTKSKLFKLADEIYIAQKGKALISTNFKTKNAEGKYNYILLQSYLFYSELPIRSTYLFVIRTNVDWCKTIKKRHHYYIGNDLSHFKYPDEKLLQIGSIYTNREFEVIKLIELGLCSEQIAKKLFVSIYTINAHRANILKKSGKTHLSELIYDLMEQGVI
jgi:hypothetical protein